MTTITANYNYIYNIFTLNDIDTSTMQVPKLSNFVRLPIKYDDIYAVENTRPLKKPKIFYFEDDNSLNNETEKVTNMYVKVGNQVVDLGEFVGDVLV